MHDPLAGLLILVAEDHEESRDFLCLLLDDAGAKTSCVGDAFSAIRSARRFAPDVVVTNLAGGGAIVRAVREATGQEMVSVCVAEDEVRRRVLAPSFTVSLVKPLPARDFVDAVRRVAVAAWQ
jgi:DNA-binding response OmpR family regulator